jgi:hypothetical protein
VEQDKKNMMTSLTDCAEQWREFYKPYAHDAPSVEKLMEMEEELVAMMNKWCGKVFHSGSHVEVAIRYLRENSYTYELKPVGAFKEMLANYKIGTYDKDDLDLKNTYNETRHTINPNVPFKETKDGEYEPQLNPRIKLKSLAQIWLNHEKAARYNQVVCNPRPSYFAAAAKSTELNKWSGFALTRDQVAEYTDWTKLMLLFNHINYSWCDNEKEFCSILARMALILQEPW